MKRNYQILRKNDIENRRVHVTVQLPLPIAEVVRDLSTEVDALIERVGLEIMQAIMEDEQARLTGPYRARDPERSAIRWAHDQGYVIYQGRKIPIPRPRVRNREGREVPLQSYRQFQHDGRMQRSVAKKILEGVSTRRYGAALDGLCEGYGIEKSSVSRHGVAVTRKKMEELLQRPLGDLELVALVFDGKNFGDHLIISGLGVDKGGEKHVLGLWEGATENAAVCTAFLEDLVRRGLDPQGKYLIVIDGGKGLRAAVRKIFHPLTPVARCHRHKIQNILGHLPVKYHIDIERRLRLAYNLHDPREAEKALAALVRDLEKINASAARSLEEGLPETLTLQRLGVPPSLQVSLRTTNMIESCFSITHHLTRNVKRYRTSDQAQRWAATALLAAERRFHRLRGHRDMPFLVQALDRHFGTVDVVTRTA